MPEVKLTKGMVAFVDDADFERVTTEHSWCASIRKDKNSVRYYAMATIRQKQILLHRFILGLTDPLVLVDHKNGNTLDCRRENMRLATEAQNRANQKKTRGSSRFKGVTLHKKSGKWDAQIGGSLGHLHLGRFDNQEDAAKAYDAAAKERFGEFAKLNFEEAACAPQ